MHFLSTSFKLEWLGLTASSLIRCLYAYRLNYCAPKSRSRDNNFGNNFGWGALFIRPFLLTHLHHPCSYGFCPTLYSKRIDACMKIIVTFWALAWIGKSEKLWTHASVSNINVSHDNEAWQKAIVSACGYLSVWTMAKQWLWGITGVRRTEAVADSLRRDSACEVERSTDRRTRHSTTATETSRIQTDNWSMCEQK